MDKMSNLAGKKSIEKEVKKMKKLILIAAVVLFVFCAAAPAFADFTVDGSEVYSASATVGGEGGVTHEFKAELYNIANDNKADSLTWRKIEAGEEDWLACQQYVTAEGWATYEVWGIQFYTDNMGDDADPKYDGTGNPAGLVREDNTIYSLPTCWRTKTRKLDPDDEDDAKDLEIEEFTLDDGTVVLSDGHENHHPGGEHEYYPWFFMLDKNTDMDDNTEGRQTFGNWDDETTFIGHKGYHHAPGDNYATPPGTDQVYYCYHGAKFTTSVPDKTYSTNTLTVEMYHE